MGLKDSLKSDLDNVFFNRDEFATEHTINGKLHTIIFDEEMLKDWMHKKNNSPDGVFTADLLYHVKKDKYGEKPSVREHQNIDGSIYRIAEVEENFGMYTIALESLQS